MKLNPRQLDSHLSSGPAPVYLVSGDEPLLVDESLDAIRAAAAKHGYTEREAHIAERGFDWAELGAGLQNMSLFAERRIVEVRLPTGKPGDQGCAHRGLSEVTEIDSKRQGDQKRRQMYGGHTPHVVDAGGIKMAHGNPEQSPDGGANKD